MMTMMSPLRNVTAVADPDADCKDAVIRAESVRPLSDDSDGDDDFSDHDMGHEPGLNAAAAAAAAAAASIASASSEAGGRGSSVALGSLASASPPPPATSTTTTTSTKPGYKRASRKNAPKRFKCEYKSCPNVYTRAEHLRRHQRNRECWRRKARGGGGERGLAAPYHFPRLTSCARRPCRPVPLRRARLPPP